MGGNHEASGYMQELPYGGWIAPRIYYLGHASVVSFAGLRIAGLSGIYKVADYNKGISFFLAFVVKVPAIRTAMGFPGSSTWMKTFFIIQQKLSLSLESSLTFSCI